jgi:hypothetical protein
VEQRLDASGATLTLPTTIEVDTIEPQSGTSLTLGASGDTITIPSGATITNSGTATGFGESNLPYFYVTRSSDQTLTPSTHVLVEYNSVKLDTASGWDNVSYRYVPDVAGKYFFQFVNQSTYSGTAPVNEYSYLRKNGTNVVETSARGNPHGYGSIPQASAILTMNGTTDYIDVTAYGDAGTNYILEGNATIARTYLLGYLISQT